MMETVDTAQIAAPPDHVFQAARDVERWPDRLAHYRWVRMLEGSSETDGIVEMAAWRPFGSFRWPTWWVSEMHTNAETRTIRYTHVRGITTGMGVEWAIHPDGNGSKVRLVHQWDGPPWPLIRRPAAEWIIGPVFVHGIASRTLAGLKDFLERTDG